MKTLKKLTLFALVLTVLLTSACKKDNEPKNGIYSEGVLISNEGPFQQGSGSISFYDPKSKTIENEIFKSVNSRPPGNIVQSIEVFENRVYIVVHNASKIEVAEAGSMKSIGVIEGLISPRYFIGINKNKAYVSEWGGHLKIIDLNTLSSTGIIMTGAAPDRMLLHGNKLWVINSAGFTSDSTVMVIDTQTDAVLQTIVVGDNPIGIVKDANNRIWVLCGGYSDWANPANNTNGSLVRINPTDFSVEMVLTLNGSDFGPRLAINKAGTKLFYSFGGIIYMRDVNAGFGAVSEVVMSKACYALGIHPETDEIYFSDPLDYNQPGVLYRYDPTGTIMLDSVRAGIIPGNFFFQ